MNLEKDPMLIDLTADIVASYIGANSIAVADVPALIERVHKTLCAVAEGAEPTPAAAPAPPVPIKKSITPDYLICLEDGKKFKSLKRHLASAFGMTPDQYRQKWGLPADYPMVAPNYAAARSELARKIGLGRPARG